MTVMRLTTVSLTPATKERLAAHGVKGDSFEIIVSKILNEVEGKPKEEKK